MLNIEETRRICEAATPIPGFSSYSVSHEGEVFSTTPWRGTPWRKLKQHKNSHGYMRVRMVDDEGLRRSQCVHKLVAMAFLPPKPHGCDQIRHLDGDKNNNCASNLCWGNAEQNAADRERHGKTARGEKNGFSKLSSNHVIAIRHLSSAGFSQRKIADFIGISQKTVGNVCREELWKHVDYRTALPEALDEIERLSALLDRNNAALNLLSDEFGEVCRMATQASEIQTAAMEKFVRGIGRFAGEVDGDGQED